MTDPFLWISLGGFFAIVVLAIWGVWLYEKNRQKKLANVANQLGFTFDPKGDATADGAFGDFDLFQKGHSRKCRNTMTGTLEDIHVTIFDYQYTTGSGKNQSTHKQTIASFQLPQPIFPAFSLQRENFFHKVGQMFGAKDIDFDNFPEFSKRYLLRGPDEQRIRDFFTNDTLRFFEQLKQKWSIEANGDRIVIYHRAKRSKPAHYNDFLKQTWEAFLAFPTA